MQRAWSLLVIAAVVGCGKAAEPTPDFDVKANEASHAQISKDMADQYKNKRPGGAHNR
jgi:hypothetical protein